MTGFLAPTSMFTFVVLVITIVICLCHVCFGHFKYLSAHNYKVWGCDREPGGGPGGEAGAGSTGCGEDMGLQLVPRAGACPPTHNFSGPSRLSTRRQMLWAPEVMGGPPLLPLSPNLR